MTSNYWQTRREQEEKSKQELLMKAPLIEVQRILKEDVETAKQHLSLAFNKDINERRQK